MAALLKSTSLISAGLNRHTYISRHDSAASSSVLQAGHRDKICAITAGHEQGIAAASMTHAPEAELPMVTKINSQERSLKNGKHSGVWCNDDDDLFTVLCFHDAQCLTGSYKDILYALVRCPINPCIKILVAQ